MKWIALSNFEFLTMKIIFVRPKLDPGLTNDLLMDKNYLQACTCSADCFTVLDSVATRYQVKLNESTYIKWEKPDLNQQVKHINLTLSL